MSRRELLNAVGEAVDLIREHVEKGVVRIVSHLDADGLSACGIMSKALYRLGVRFFRASIERKVDEDLMQSLLSERPKPTLIVFTDMGGSYLDIISSYTDKAEFVILDHHIPVEADAADVVHVNPRIHGLDGSREVSGAGLAYLTAVGLDEANKDLAPLAVVGALGDRQDKGDRKSLTGVNEMIVRDAVERGLLKVSTDLLFYGHETRPVYVAMAYTTSPFLPGLSGREDACLALLKRIGVEVEVDGRWRAVRDLSMEEKRRIVSGIAEYLASRGVKPDVAHELIGTVYTMVGEEDWTPLRDCREYASLLNACARMGKMGVGVAVCMGDRGRAFKEAEETLTAYRRAVAEGLRLAWEGGMVRELDNVYYLKAGSQIDDRIIGVVASIILSSGILEKDKPVIALADMREEPGMVKASGRAREDMKVNLGVAMMKAASECGGRGGGHDIAAGAFIPKGCEDRFIRLVDYEIGGQRG